MKALLKNDKLFATEADRAFCSPGGKRDTIDLEEAKTCFDFELNKFKSCTEDGRPIDNQWHLRRSDDDEIVPSRGLGNEFTPIQHKAVFDFITTKIAPKIPDFKFEVIGTLHGGGTGIFMAQLGKEFSITGDKSPQNARLFMFNPNGRSSLVLGMTTVRLWCQNQLRAAVNTAGKGGFRIIHSTNAQVECANALEVIKSQVDALEWLKKREERLAHVKVGDKELKLALNNILPLSAFEEGSRGWTRMLNQREEVIRQFTEGETAQEMTGEKTGWTLLNSFTRPLHNPASIGKTTDLAQITYSNTAGNRSDKMLNILDTIEKITEVA